MYIYLHYVIIGLKASPTIALSQGIIHLQHLVKCLMIKNSSGLFSLDRPQEGTAGSPARKKACSSKTTSLHIRTHTYAYVTGFGKTHQLRTKIII